LATLPILRATDESARHPTQERLCVAPYCRPRQAVHRLRGPPAGGGRLALTTRADDGSEFRFVPPPPSAAPAPPPVIDHPGPGLVLLGCDGCGVPELARSLAASRLAQLAVVCHLGAQLRSSHLRSACCL